MPQFYIIRTLPVLFSLSLKCTTFLGGILLSDMNKIWIIKYEFYSLINSTYVSWCVYLSLVMYTQWNIFEFIYTCIFYRHAHLQVQCKLDACHTIVTNQILMPCLDLLQSVQDSAGRIPQNKPQLLLLCPFTPIHLFDTIWPMCEFKKCLNKWRPTQPLVKCCAKISILLSYIM